MAEYIISGETVTGEICKALDIDPGRVRRIILDLPADGMVVAYVEMIADTRFLDIKWEFNNAVTVTLEEQR